MKETCRITIFGTLECKHCRRTKTLFNAKELFSVFIDVQRFPLKKKDMIDLSGRHSVPQVFFNNYHIGGASDVFKLDDAKKLDSLYEYISNHDLFAYNSEIPDLIDIISDRENKREALDFSVFCNVLDSRLVLNAEELAENEMRSRKAVFSVATVMIPIKEEKVIYATLLTHMLTKFRFFDYRISCLKTEKNCFSSEDAISVLMGYFNLKSTKDCIKICEALVFQNVFLPINHNDKFDDIPKTFKLRYHMLLQSSSVLNEWHPWSESPRQSMDIIVGLYSFLSYIEQRHVISSNGTIDFVGIYEDPMYLNFQVAVCELQIVDLYSMQDPEKVAFILNCYNLLVKHTLIEKGIPKWRTDFSKLFGKVYYRIGTNLFCLDDLENGILRQNRRHPYGLYKPFAATDSRHDLTVQEFDYRIHFALNCGAASCPPVNIYSKDAIEDELSDAAIAYCENDKHVLIDLQKKILSVSRIFAWYRVDFGGSKASLVGILLKWCSGKKLEDLEKLTANGNTAWTLAYLPYDWSFNEYRPTPFKL